MIESLVQKAWQEKGRVECQGKSCVLILKSLKKVESKQQLFVFVLPGLDSNLFVSDSKDYSF